MCLIMNCRERRQDMINHGNYLAVVKLEPEKDSGLNQIRTHRDLWDTGSYAVRWYCDYHSCLYMIFDILIFCILLFPTYPCICSKTY